MKNIVQMAVIYGNNKIPFHYVSESINRYISDGWRVHTCIERGKEILVIYEKENDSKTEGD